MLNLIIIVLTSVGVLGASASLIIGEDTRRQRFWLLIRIIAGTITVVLFVLIYVRQIGA